MKKLLIFVFALVMALTLTLTSCQDEICTQHKDDNADGICDVCETEIPPEHTVHKDENTDGLCDECKAIFIDYEKPSVVGTLLKGSIEKQFTEAKSFKVDIDFSFLYSNKYSYMEEGAPVTDSEYAEGIADIDIWVTEGEKYDNAKITVTLKDRNNPEAEFENDSSSGTIYIIDGYVYEPAIDGTFVKSELIPAEVQKILDQVSEMELFTEEEKNELLTSLSLEIATVFNIKNNVGSLTVDAKPHVDKLLAYVAALNMEEDTLRKVVDDVLKLASPELTSTALLTELDRIAALTVNEAIAELDAWLTTNYSTTVQGIYDSLVNDEQVMALVEEILIQNTGIDITDPEQKAELDSTIANIKTLKIADLIANQGIGEVPLYDIIASIASSEESEGEPVYVTREQFFERINTFLDMTLAEFEETLNAPIFTTVKHYAAGLTVNKLYGRVDLNFENILALKSINGIFEADITYSEPSEVSGENNVVSVVGKLTFKISDISNQPLQIVIPENSTQIDASKIDAYYYVDGSSLWISDYYVIEGKAYVDIDYHTYNSEYSGTIEIMAREVPLSELINDVITISEFTATFNGTATEPKEGSALKLSIDAENDDFTVVQLPDGILPPAILHAFTMFAENQTTTWNGYTLDSSMSRIMMYSNECEIVFASGTGLQSVYVTVEYDTETDRLVCTIIGFTVDPEHLVYRVDKSTSWYGGEYEPDNINTYFGGDITFEIYIDEETNTIKCDSIPNILEEYRNNWPTEESNQ